MSKNRRNKGGYTQNHGRPGVVYILGNRTFPSLLKVGQTTNMARRLAQLNDDCNTSNPISGFFILHQRRTTDCGRAEILAHDLLKGFRLNNYREFFEVPLDTAKKAIDNACDHYDRISAESEKKAREEREAEERRRAAAIAAEETRRRNEVLETQRRAAEIIALAKKHAASSPTANVLTSDTTKSPPETASPPVSTASKAEQGVSASLRNFALVSTSVALIAIAVIEDDKPAAAQQALQKAETTLSSDLKSYAAAYRYPKQVTGDETVLVDVSAFGESLRFLYMSTSIGERIMTRDFDPAVIRSNMQTTACAKPEIRAFLSRGASVSYVLKREDGREIFAQVNCAT